MISLSLGEIVRTLGGKVEGNAETRSEKIGTLEGADASSITYLAQERFLGALRETHAGAVILATDQCNATQLPRIVCGNPHAYFARVTALLHPAAVANATAGIHPRATVDSSATLGNGVSVGPNAVVGRDAHIGDGVSIGANCYVGDGVTIGAGTQLWPGVAIYHGCRIGERVVLHAGVVIGADGFGNAWDINHWLKVPQIGRAIIGNDVEIGANTTVDRGAIDDTVIEDGVRLDNLIMIAHNVHVGAHTAIAACTGIAGSARIGNNCALGGASMIYGHITIGDNINVSAGTLIMKSLDEPGIYTGVYPFTSHQRWLKNASQLRQLDELARRVRALEKHSGKTGEEQS